MFVIESAIAKAADALGTDAMLIQQQRSNKANGLLNNKEVKATCVLSKENNAIIKKAIEILNLSARGFYRILKVARTIADLDNSTNIQTMHLNEALGFRSKSNLQR